MKKIGFITTNDGHPWGGSEELWSLTALWLLKMDVQVAVSIKKWEKKHRNLTGIEQSGGSIFFRTNSVSRSTVGKVRARLFPYHEKEKIQAMNSGWLDEFKPDLVVISLGHNMQGVQWMKACIERKIPYVIVVHLILEHKWPLDKDVEAIREGYTKAARTFFVAKKNHTFTEFQIGAALPNAEIVRNPFKVNWQQQFSWPFDDQTVKIACIASLSAYHKGHDILFQVLSLEKWRKRPLFVTLLGSGPHKENLMKLKERLNLENVTFGGFVDDIEAVWQEHQALIMASRIEGLPITLVEAMLCGRIAIVPDVSGNSELVDDGENGFLAQAPTVGLLDDALERAWQKRGDWEAMGRKAAAKARSVMPENPAQVFGNKILGMIQSNE